MARWSGKLGFRTEVEISPGVWKQVIVERKYYGDIVRDYRALENESEINPTLNILNKISLISDPYATENVDKVIYITYLGKKWKASTIEVDYPRFIIGLGGRYNEQN